MRGFSQLFAFATIWLLASIVTFGAAGILLGLLLLAIFLGAEGRAEKASKDLKTTLMSTEELIAEAIQHRIFGLFSRRTLVAITNSRIIVLRRGLLGGFKMMDIQWKDLKDVTISRNVMSSLCGSQLQFSHLNPTLPMIIVDGVPVEAAATIYSTAQYQEQAWEEKRRVRAMEETRAKAGGVVVNNGPSPVAQTQLASPGNRMLEEIQKAKELFDMGAVSDAEFQEMKAKILGAA